MSFPQNLMTFFEIHFYMSFPQNLMTFFEIHFYISFPQKLMTFLEMYISIYLFFVIEDYILATGNNFQVKMVIFQNFIQFELYFTQMHSLYLPDNES